MLEGIKVYFWSLDSPDVYIPIHICAFIGHNKMCKQTNVFILDNRRGAHIFTYILVQSWVYQTIPKIQIFCKYARVRFIIGTHTPSIY